MTVLTYPALADELVDAPLAVVLELVEAVGRCLHCGVADHAGRGPGSTCCPDCQHPAPWGAA